MEVSVIFQQLESNQPDAVEEAKKLFHEALNSTKESWLVNSFLDYFINTNSPRCVEILVGVREPHDKHLFDRLLEMLKGSSKLQALTFLGQIVHGQPPWLYRITQHPLFKELVKLLRTEMDILSLMSALLVIIVLLPMFPALVGAHLQELFEIFSRLAAWNTNNPNKLPEEHLLHLQVSLYSLFLRLYAMYPCNFLSYLRREYGQPECLGIFSHTIKPILDTVRVHPMLVTATKDAETTAARWKSMEHHDVMVECAKLAIDTVETVQSNQIEQSKIVHCALKHSSHDLLMHHQLEFTKIVELFSPSRYCGLQKTPPLPETLPSSIPQPSSSQIHAVLPSQEGTSPPEAAIEATPETTPVKDPRRPPSSKTVRALNSFSETTPTHSQPSSPLKKEQSPFHFLGERPLRRDSLMSRRIQLVQQEKAIATEQPPSPIMPELAPEDQEVVEIVEQGQQLKSLQQRTCDSVLQEFHPHVDEYEECTRDSSSPCCKGGLHLPTSNSMLSLAERVQRFYGPQSDVHCEMESFSPAQFTEKMSIGTQTVSSAPYEHLFLGIVPVVSSKILYSPENLLDKYIEYVVHTNDSECEVWRLKDQLVLFNLQLQFERQRREVHAERNRRLLGKSRSNRALEEHNSALCDQLSLLQRDKESLHVQLERMREDNYLQEERLQETISYWQKQFSAEQRKSRDLAMQVNIQEQELAKAKETTAALNQEFSKVESVLFAATKDHPQSAVIEQLRTSLEQAHKEIILMGELQQKYRERFSQLTVLQNFEEEKVQLLESYRQEVQTCHELLEVRTSERDASNARVLELEKALLGKDNVIAEQKRLLKNEKEQYCGQLEAVESKYNAQRALNQKLEEFVMELNQRGTRGNKSPDDTASVSSGEKQLGPNSPLSQSLCSAEGVCLSTILGGQGMEMKDLQQIVDKPSVSSSANVSSDDLATPSTSGFTTDEHLLL
ncbi:hamartin [Bacillus rossius redtenbacheri]|uniref:hamartin n=1 Tax=Bacillus rossius redtenbacheri TaxID=93214 RepID=UPI002FDCAB69